MPPKKRRLTAAAVDASNSALQRLLHRGNVSQTGLAQLLHDVQSVAPDLPSTVNRHRLQDANFARFDAVRHTMQVPLADGGSWDWELADPNMLISLMVRESEVLQDLFGRAIARHRPSQENPWTLIIGYDEFSPGGMFDVANDRKSMNLSFTFLQLGEHNIRSDNAWFTPVVVRHSKVCAADGSWGAMLRDYLHLQLLGPSGLTTAGVPVTIEGEHVLIYASLDYMVADLDGHKQGLDVKGANGYRPCLRHMNVLKKNSGTVELDPAASFVEITCAEPNRFKKFASSDIYDAADSLRVAHESWIAGHMTKARYENIKKVLGLNFAPKGILLDRELRAKIDVIGSTVIDWVHCELQDGVFTVEVTLLLQACSDALGISWEDLHAYFRDLWQFPAWGKVKSKALYKVFDRRRSPQEAKVKASASELLGLYALLRHFAEVYLIDAPGIGDHVASFRAACATMDIIMLTKRGHLTMRDGARQLRAAHADHLQKHITAYGTDHVLPKHHMMFDVADQWETSETVVDAFVVERLHIRVKQVVNPIRNTRVFERSCLSSLLNVHLLALGDRTAFGDSLVGHVGQFPGAGVPIADQMLVSGMSTRVGDIVLLQGMAGLVRACAQEGDNFFAVVETYIFSSAVSAHSDRWQPGGPMEAWPAEALMAAGAWYPDGDGVVVLRV